MRYRLRLVTKILQYVLLIALLRGSFPLSPVLAQSLLSPRQERGGSFGGPGESRCAVAVEPQIVLSRKESGFGRPDRVVDFTITVFITNQCQEPVHILHDSFVSYQTNFPLLIEESSQPPECVTQQRSFSGLIPPQQKVPFAFRVQGCTFPASQMENPRVTLDTGMVVTDKGEKPIPAVTEVLP